jgi:hypothetical protein
MRAADTTAFGVCWAFNNDGFNLFHRLPEDTVDGGTHCPIHRGINFSYDSAKSKLHVAIQFRQAYPGDASLRDHLHFDLPPPDEGGSSDSDFKSSIDMEVEIEEGPPIVSRPVVLEVRWITAGATHAICFVVESLHNDYIEGTEWVLTMTAACLLYKEYHNDR